MPWEQAHNAGVLSIGEVEVDVLITAEDIDLHAVFLFFYLNDEYKIITTLILTHKSCAQTPRLRRF